MNQDMSGIYKSKDTKTSDVTKTVADTACVQSECSKKTRCTGESCGGICIEESLESLTSLSGLLMISEKMISDLDSARNDDSQSESLFEETDSLFGKRQ